MTWTLHSQTVLTSFEIYSNVQQVNYQNAFFKQQKAWFKFKRLNFNAGSLDTVYINGSKFELYGAIGAEFLIEITNYIAAVETSAAILIQNWMTDPVLSIPFNAIKGLARTRVVSDSMPSIIPIMEGSELPFYVQFINGCEWLNKDGGVEVMGSDDLITSVEIRDRINGGLKTNLIRTMNGTFDETFDFTFNSGEDDQRDVILAPIDCDQDVVLLEWLGKFGEIKSWWFEVTKTITESTKALDMATIEDGFNTLKNKQMSLLLTSKRCDIYNQTYLSDLVISDAVYIYDGYEGLSKIQVKVAANNFETENKRKDILMIVNTLKYDII